jgi:acetolactate synthase-1/3 small subunit
MRHIISILLQNEAGALARVAGLFAARGYNIDSLTVAATQVPEVSRLTMVITGENAVIEQILAQSRKLVDVLEVADLTASAHLESELLIVKARVPADGADALDACLYRHHSFTIDETDGVRTVQFAGPGPMAEAFVRDLRAVTEILELARSGAAALQCGPAVLGVPAPV